ncbi:ABC transporter permease [Ralstonia pickettii]|nr:ABC transporter permease [Ralstonia pickettii]
MKAILKTRLILWKKTWVSLGFWLLLPIILTIGLLTAAHAIQEDSKIPVGIVIEKETPLINNLIAELKHSPLLQIVETTENEAKRLVESHKLDSAFVIKQGYENNIKKGNRNRLITGYASDLSFAYPVIRETILSLIQKDSGRAKTVETVYSISPAEITNWSEEEIIDRIVQIEKKQDLLNSSFAFAGEETPEIDNHLFFNNPWFTWAIFTLLSTLLLFDWLIKEKHGKTTQRLAFSRFSMKGYLLLNTVLYLSVFLCIDSITMFIFKQMYDIDINIGLLLQIFCFHLTATAFAFLLAICFRKVTHYYAISFVITLFVTITSGAFLPIEGLGSRFEWVELLNPIQPFLTGKLWSPWVLIFLCFVSFWFIKGEKQHA